MITFWVLLPYKPSRGARIPPTMGEHYRSAAIDTLFLKSDVLHRSNWKIGDVHVCKMLGANDLEDSVAITVASMPYEYLRNLYDTARSKRSLKVRFTKEGAVVMEPDIDGLIESLFIESIEEPPDIIIQ